MKPSVLILTACAIALSFADRADSTAAVSAQSLVEIAYAATRSERVEVSCYEIGAVGYETHNPI